MLAIVGQLEGPDPQKAKLKHFEQAMGPVARVHIDVLGPVYKKMFLSITNDFT